MNDEIKNKPLEWFWNIKTAFNHDSNFYNDWAGLNARYTLPFPSYPPKIGIDTFIKIANEENNDCNLFIDCICPRCNDPQVVCIVENRNSFERYKQLKKCGKKVRNKQDNTVE
jgi:hypothetical protein